MIFTNLELSRLHNVNRKRILPELTSSGLGGKYKYNWAQMPDNDKNNITNVQNNVAPLLYDLGIAMGVYYKLDLYGNPTESTITLYDGAEVIKDFGFEHAAYFGSSSAVNNVLDFILNRWTDTLRKIIEINLDYGHPVSVGSYNEGLGGHTYVLEGYGHYKNVYLSDYKHLRHSENLLCKRSC
jgi:hypothetical protein